MEKNKVLIAILALLAISSAVGYQYFKGEKNNYFEVIKETYQAVAEIQSDLSVSAGNLSASDAGTVENFIGKLNSSKDILLEKNNSFGNINVPGKFEDDNKKLLECLKTEYNLINRWKESVAITNEYEAAENFTKSKELVLGLKEKSAMLNIEGNNFENIFDLSATYGKIEKYLNVQKQLRYDKDTKEQAEREAAAAAERERIEREKNTFYVGYRFFRNNQRIMFTSNDLTIKVGQTLHIFLEDSSETPTYVRMLSDGLWNNCSYCEDGNHGVVLTAKSIGRFRLEFIPEFDWNKSGTIYINIVP